MELQLKRKWLFDDCTLGELWIDGLFFCYTCEDFYRGDAPKVPGKTCIPNGTYNVKKTYSPKYKRDMYLVENVPGFVGIRLHSGNTADDSEGCILLGQIIEIGKRRILESRSAMKTFEELLDRSSVKTHQLTVSLDKQD